MKRVVAGVIGLAAGAALMVGCSDDSGKSAGQNSPSAAAGPQEVLKRRLRHRPARTRVARRLGGRQTQPGEDRLGGAERGCVEPRRAIAREGERIESRGQRVLGAHKPRQAVGQRRLHEEREGVARRKRLERVPPLEVAKRPIPEGAVFVVTGGARDDIGIPLQPATGMAVIEASKTAACIAPWNWTASVMEAP